MSNLAPFIEKLEHDPALQARFDTLLAGSPEDARAGLLAFSAELGLPLTEEDLRTLASTAELSVGELSNVAGGGVLNDISDKIDAWAAKYAKRIRDLLVASND